MFYRLYYDECQIYVGFRYLQYSGKYYDNWYGRTCPIYGA